MAPRAPWLVELCEDGEREFILQFYGDLRKHDEVPEQWKQADLRSRHGETLAGEIVWENMMGFLNNPPFGMRRSVLQILFHAEIMKAWLPLFHGTDFQRYYDRILRAHGMTSHTTDVIITTGRRIGKTVALIMIIAAALLYMPKYSISVFAHRSQMSRLIVRKVKEMVMSCSVKNFEVISDNQDSFAIKKHGAETAQYVYAHSSNPDMAHAQKQRNMLSRLIGKMSLGKGSPDENTNKREVYVEYILDDATQKTQKLFFILSSDPSVDFENEDAQKEIWERIIKQWPEVNQDDYAVMIDYDYPKRWVLKLAKKNFISPVTSIGANDKPKRWDLTQSYTRSPVLTLLLNYFESSDMIRKLAEPIDGRFLLFPLESMKQDALLSALWIEMQTAVADKAAFLKTVQTLMPKISLRFSVVYYGQDKEVRIKKGVPVSTVKYGDIRFSLIDTAQLEKENVFPHL